MYMRILDRFIAIVAGAALITSTVFILVNVTNRYLVQGGLLNLAEKNILPGLYDFMDTYLSQISATADEVPGLLLVWVAFLGAYLAMRDGGHIAFEMLVDKLPIRAKKTLKYSSDLLISVFLIVLFYQSWRMIDVDGATEIETAEIGQGWFMSVLVIFSVLMLIAIGHQLLQRIRER